MKMTIYVDGAGTSPSDATVFACTLSPDDKASVVIKDQPLILPRGRTLMLDVSKASGSRYSIWIRDGDIPLLVFTSVVDVFANSRIQLNEGYFLNIHVEENGGEQVATSNDSMQPDFQSMSAVRRGSYEVKDVKRNGD